MKTASPEFLKWFRQIDRKSTSPEKLIGKFAESKSLMVHGSPASNESQRLLELADWAAGVAVEKINRQARRGRISLEIGTALCAYDLLLMLPPAGIGAMQLKEIRNRRDAAASLAVSIIFNGHIKPRDIVMDDSAYLRKSIDFHSLF
jgi:hypothetical protein